MNTACFGSICPAFAIACAIVRRGISLVPALLSLPVGET
jgi:hypothetical protein